MRPSPSRARARPLLLLPARLARQPGQIAPIAHIARLLALALALVLACCGMAMAQAGAGALQLHDEAGRVSAWPAPRLLSGPGGVLSTNQALRQIDRLQPPSGAPARWWRAAGRHAGLPQHADPGHCAGPAHRRFSPQRPAQCAGKAGPFDVAGQHCKVGLPVGLTMGFALAPHDGSHADDLLKRADAVMHAGKQAGRNTVRRGGASAGQAFSS